MTQAYEVQRMTFDAARRAMTFEQWLAKVDSVLISRCGLSSDDLPDWCYRDAYEDGTSPRQAAQQAMSNSGLRS